MSVALVAPNAIQCLKSFGFIPGKRERQIMERARDRLIVEKSLKYEAGRIVLTEQGQRKLELLDLQDWKLEKPKKWDGRWRMLIFDIPETKRGIRQKLRTTLLYIGFIRLQDSVWIYPYDCEDLISLLKVDFQVGKDLLYVIADSVENDRSFRKSFGLSLEK